MSICAKAMSRGVHNIAFSLSPDIFWPSNLGNEPESGHENYPFVLLEISMDVPTPNDFDLDRPVKGTRSNEPWGLIKPLTVDMGESGDEG